MSAVLVTVAGLEIGVRVLASENEARSMPGQSAYHVMPDDELGYRLRPSVRSRAAKVMPDGARCYDVVYSTDESGRRVVGAPAGAPEHRPPLVLFGCSYTMGEGLPDQHTLAFHLGRHFEIFNYAVHAYGPQHTLALLRSGRLEHELPAGKAIGLHVLYAFQLGRAAVGSDDTNLWKSPYFELRDDGSLEAFATFSTAHPWLTIAYRGLDWASERSALLRRARQRWERVHDFVGGEIAAAILTEAARRFEERWQGPFVVAVESGEQHPEIPPLIERLRANGVTVVDHSATRRSPSDRVCAGDSHPGAAFVAALAARLEPHLLRLSGGSGGSS